MAMKVLNSIDLVGTQLLNARLQNVAGDVTVGNTAQIYYDTGTNIAKVANGTAIDKITNILESVTASGALHAGAITAKAIALTIDAASGTVPGTMTSAHYTLVNGATALNTNSTLVERDGSGNFAAGTITATLTGTASNATQLNSQAASFYLARANHTGTQLAATISDFDTQVRTSTINQLTAPTADYSMNTHKITNLVDPASPQDAATKAYVDATSTGLDVKSSVRVASTANVTQATYNATNGTSARGQMTATTNSIDGVTLVAGNRILLKNQTTGAQNGIWTVTTAGTGVNGTWDRATDFDQDAEVTAGAFTFVEEGTANSDSGWVLTTNNPIVIGGASGTSLAFAQFSSAGSFTQGNGINIGGGVISAVADTTTVNANSLSVSSTGVTIATTYVGQSSITTLGTVTTGTWSATAIAVAKGGTGGTSIATARTGLGTPYQSGQGGTAVTTSGTAGYYSLTGSSTTYTVTHSIGTLAVLVQVFEVSTGNVVYPDVQLATVNTVVITFATAPTTGQYAVVVVG